MCVNSDISWWQSKLTENLHYLDEIYHIMLLEVLSSIFKRKKYLDDQAYYIFMAV